MDIKPFIDSIINASSPALASKAAAIARKEIEAEIVRLSDEMKKFDRYEKFASATGETYTIPLHVANWLELAVHPQAFNKITTKLQNVHVCEYGGRLWLSATDGCSLHAYATNDIPAGTYCMAGNRLRLAANQDYPNWTDVLPEEPTTLGVKAYKRHDGDDNTFALWIVKDGVLTPPNKAKDANYGMNEGYLKAALSLTEEAPEYSKQADKNMSPLLLRWPNAMALIMPINIEGLYL